MIALTYAELQAENAALKAQLARASKWVAPANADQPEPDAHTRRFGSFTAQAWPDGFWAIGIKHKSSRAPLWIRECRRGEEAESLELAQAAAEGVMRNLLADAVSDLGEAP